MDKIHRRLRNHSQYHVIQPPTPKTKKLLWFPVANLKSIIQQALHRKNGRARRMDKVLNMRILKPKREKRESAGQRRDLMDPRSLVITLGVAAQIAGSVGFDLHLPDWSRAMAGVCTVITAVIRGQCAGP